MKRQMTLEEIVTATKGNTSLRKLQRQCASGRLKARKKIVKKNGKKKLTWVVDLADMLQRNGFEELIDDLTSTS